MNCALYKHIYDFVVRETPICILLKRKNICHYLSRICRKTSNSWKCTPL